jgi:hypothetical protein
LAHGQALRKERRVGVVVYSDHNVWGLCGVVKKPTRGQPLREVIDAPLDTDADMGEGAPGTGPDDIGLKSAVIAIKPKVRFSYCHFDSKILGKC